MAFPVLPVAGAAIVALLLLASSSKAETTPPAPPPPEPPPPHPNNRPKRPANPPAGFIGWGIAAPACGPNDPAKCRNGLLVHSTPNSDPGTLVSPEDTSPTSLHVLTGDEPAILRNDVPDQSVPKTSRVWAQVMTPMGNVGYVSYIDTQGRKNFTGETPASQPAPTREEQIGGVGGYGWQGYSNHRGYPIVGAAQARYVRCVAPMGCRLVGGPLHGGSGGVIVENGAMLRLLTSSPNGYALVRYHDRLQGPVDGWLPSALLRG